MRLRNLILTFIMTCSIIVPIIAQNQPRVEVKKLSAHLYHLVVTTTYSVNALASVGPDGILLVDPGMEAASVQLKETLKNLGGGEIRYVIYSHNHGHHFDAVKQLEGNPVIIAHENVRVSMQSGFDLLQEWPEKALPNITLNQSVSIYFNGEKIDVIPIIGSHSNGDVVIHFTGSKVVAMGGLLTSDVFPFIDRNYGGIFSYYPVNVQKVLEEFPVDANYYPAHDRVHTWNDLKKYHTMLEKTIQIVREEFAQGKSTEVIQQANVLHEWESYGQGFVTADVWIQTIINGLTKKGPEKKTIIEPLFYALKSGDGKSAVKVFHDLKKNKAEVYFFDENSLNLLGYYLLGKNRIDDAVEIFKLNVTEYPDSWNVYDSLGEAYMLKGDNKQAVKNYKKSIMINPENNNGKEILKQMGIEG